MITDYYGDGNRYRGVTSTGGKTRTIVIAGNDVLHDTANDREDADHKRKEPKIMNTTKQAVEAEQAERATPMRKAEKFTPGGAGCFAHPSCKIGAIITKINHRARANAGRSE